MKSVKFRNGLLKELGGNKRGYEAIGVTLNRKLIGDIMRQSRRPGTITGVDAALFYDRIVH